MDSEKSQKELNNDCVERRIARDTTPLPVNLTLFETTSLDVLDRLTPKDSPKYTQEAKVGLSVQRHDCNLQSDAMTASSVR